MINEYFDGELDKKSEISLFVLLSQNDEAREYFKSLNVLETTVSETQQEFPIELEERILRSVAKTSEKSGFLQNTKIFSAIPYATVLVLLFLSGYLFFKVSGYQEKVDNLSKQMMFQSRTIQLLYNSLPGVEVRATFDNEIIVKPKI
jgi:hypothetical protein